MRLPPPVASRLRDQARRRPRVAAAVSGAARRFGAGSVASRIERAADLVTVPVPGLNAAIRLAGGGGRDHTANQLRDLGWSAFEPPLPDVFLSLLRAAPPGGMVLDVGANTGFYALLVAAARPDLRVYAFEPFPPVLEVLRENVALNQCGDRVTIVPEAVGERPGHAVLYVPDAGHGFVETSASLNPGFAGSHRSGTELKVPVTTLDGSRPWAPSTVATMKVDVESLEAAVLRGATSLLARDRPPVVLEVLGGGDQDLEDLRARLGYVDVRLGPETLIVGEPVAYDEQRWNHLWVPEERCGPLLDVLSRVGVPLVRAGDDG